MEEGNYGPQRDCVELKSQSDSTSRHGGPSAPGELVGTVVASSGDDGASNGGYEWWRRVATNGDYEWWLRVATKGGLNGRTQEGADVESPFWCLRCVVPAHRSLV